MQITGCRFREVGDQGVCIGGGSRFEEFASRPGEDAKAGTLFEAARVQVRRCLFQGSRCAVALVNCERSLVRNCTIHRPTRAIMSFRREQEDGRFGDVRYCAFGSNLVVWKAEDITQVAHLGPNMDASAVGIDLEDNFWWCGDAARTAAALEGLPGNELFPQVTELAPKLDEELRPTEERAKPFGAHAP